MVWVVVPLCHFLAIFPDSAQAAFFLKGGGDFGHFTPPILGKKHKKQGIFLNRAIPQLLFSSLMFISYFHLLRKVSRVWSLVLRDTSNR